MVNKSLEWLDIRETDIPQEFLWTIQKCLRRNRRDEDETSISDDIGECTDLEADSENVAQITPTADDQTSIVTESNIVN